MNWLCCSAFVSNTLTHLLSLPHRNSTKPTWKSLNSSLLQLPHSQSKERTLLQMEVLVNVWRLQGNLLRLPVELQQPQVLVDQQMNMYSQLLAHTSRRSNRVNLLPKISSNIICILMWQHLDLHHLIVQQLLTVPGKDNGQHQWTDHLSPLRHSLELPPLHPHPHVDHSFLPLLLLSPGRHQPVSLTTFLPPIMVDLLSIWANAIHSPPLHTGLSFHQLDTGGHLSLTSNLQVLPHKPTLHNTHMKVLALLVALLASLLPQSMYKLLAALQVPRASTSSRVQQPTWLCSHIHSLRQVRTQWRMCSESLHFSYANFVLVTVIMRKTDPQNAQLHFVNSPSN